MNKQLRLIWLVIVASLALGAGSLRQPSWAAWQIENRAGNELKQLFSPAVASKAFTPAPRPAPGLTSAAPLATITVTSLADGAANAANCRHATNCRLRDAIAAAAAGDTINFSVIGTITLTSGVLGISKNLTIQGPAAAQLTISGNAASLVFSISSGRTVELSGLTVANGYNNQWGGGIDNLGILTITNSAISGNTNSFFGGAGIAIHGGGTAYITNSTISGNRISGSGGGGIYITSNSTAYITNSTISDNWAVAGGGINNAGSLTLINSTVSGNLGINAGPGGGLYGSGTTKLRNSIIAGNNSDLSSKDVSGTFTSLGYNLIGNNTGATITPTTGDQIGTAAAPINPLLAPLGNYGGPTQTHALLPGSPALSAGDNCVLTNACASDNLGFNLTTDQRGAGFNRQVGSAVDIGAFESGGFTLAVSGGNNQSAPTTMAFASPLSVTVSSTNSEPVNGGRVTFTPPVSGPRATIAGNPATIASGTATSGTVTANATIGGPYNVVASANGATSVNFALTNTNNAPLITGGTALTRQRGSAGTGGMIATVSDLETAAGSLVVMATTVPAGLSVTGITNTAGTITATVAAGCTATLGANTVVLTVTDANSGTATANLTVNVTANTAPTLTYTGASVSAGGSTSNSPTAATDNGSITGYAVQSPGTYTGTISVNASGVVSISSAAPVGAHTITIRATDNCGATTDTTFTLSVGNNLPTITPNAALTRQQGSTGSVSTIATVSDSETAAGSLIVTATTVPAGITVTSITNTAGTITANVAAGCTATLGNNTVILTVTDGNSGTATANLTVNVTANTAPTLTYGSVSVNSGGATTNSPTTATDNGSITGYAVQSQGTYTGTISVNASGVVSIGNAAPVGNHTITIRATDNCGATKDATFTLTVNSTNTAPVFTPAAAISRQQGSPAGAAVTVGTVSDAETAAGSLTVTQIAGGTATGITVAGITNTNGTITALVSASCTAVGGTVRFQVSDGSLTGTGDLTVNLTANTAPTLVYGNAAVNAGGSTTNAPTTATDNGSITGYAVQNQGTYTGTISVNASGVVSLSNAIPVGNHTITIRATDNCGATTDATFTLTVNCQTITVTAPVTNTGTAGTAFTATFTQANGIGATTFSTASALPAGVTLSGAGVLSGTPTQTGAFPLTVKATDANGCQGTVNYTLTINCPGVTVNPSSLGSSATGATFSQTFTQTGGIGTITWSLIGTAPPGLTFNAGTATLSGIPTQSGSFTFTIRATDSNNCFGERQYTLGVDCASITVSPMNASLSGGTAGTPYNQNFTAVGGASPHTFTISAGTLPPGLTLSTGGALSGSPTGFGNFNFTVKATDVNGCFGERAYTLRICGIITLTASLPAGTTGVAYNQTITASGGASPYSFAVTGGNLPPGLSLSSSGALTGTPTQNGSFNFTVTATDASGCTGAQGYTIGIGCQIITVNPATLSNGSVGTAYSQGLTAAGGTAPYSFTVSTGMLPNGLNLSSGGALTGAPTTLATFTFTIRATDANNCTGERQYTMTINPAGNGLQFYPLSSPVRLLDTRPGASPTACSQPSAPISSGTSRTQSARAFCGIPANAAAITGNVTTVASGGGYLALYPSGATQPTVASTNYNPNEVINNVFTVGLGATDGAFNIFALNTTDVVVDITGYYAPPAAGGLYFHPLPSPVRLLETRAGQSVGCVKPDAPLVGGADSLQTATTDCTGIPAAARAIVGNATTISPQAGGYLTLFPADATRPVIASSNYNFNQIINGPFTVGLSATGQFKIFTLATTDLVVDVLGYYSTEASDANGAGLLFTPLAHPIRLLETRAGQPIGCFKPSAPLNGNQVYTQTAQGACDGLTIPTNALGVVGNATVITPLSGGYLTLWPSTALQPTVATANYNAGQVVNRHFLVGLGSGDGAFKMFSLATTELVIDLSGYFAP